MKTVHLIGNAHLDPVWLWRKAEGADAVLATARSACDRLAEYPQFVFTCSGQWFHRTVEVHDPGLFERVKGFVRAGRWRLVGGMVVQPDCNLPSAESFARQLAAGQGYYRRTFGQVATVGYNVDSFGHGAYLPRFLRQGGMDSYVFMRPGPREKKLPGNLFRWESPDGFEVLTFRIAGIGYCTGAEDLRKNIEAALADMGDLVEDVMCFYGVGDHGGGPTRRQIEWLTAHAGDFAGVRLAFSHPRAFFDAVAGRREVLPVVSEELQHHAIGCYSVERRIKTAMRRAEAGLVQAEQCLQTLGGGGNEAVAPMARDVLDRAWSGVLFDQFHDVLGGTCLDRDNLLAAGGLLAAQSQAEEVVTLLTRRAFRDRAETGRHKVVVLNPSDEAFDGYVEHEPWLQWGPAEGLRLLDEQGRPIACQVIEPRAKMRGLTRVVFRIAAPARSHRLLTIVTPPDGQAAPPTAGAQGAGGQAGAAAPTPLRVSATELANAWINMTDPGDAAGGIRLGDWTIGLDVYDEPSDTWSHSCVNRFGQKKLGSFQWTEPWAPVEAGPLRAGARRPAAFEHSRLWCRAMATADEPLLRLRLSVVWAQARQRLVLRLAGAGQLDGRLDLVSGGAVRRPIDGLEYPLTGGLIVGAGRGTLGVIAPEVMSASVQPAEVQLTLLRSPYVAHHDPMPAELRPDAPVTDQGRHEFELALWPGCPLSGEAPARLARQMLAPPIIWDLTG